MPTTIERDDSSHASWKSQCGSRGYVSKTVHIYESLISMVWF